MLSIEKLVSQSGHIGSTASSNMAVGLIHVQFSIRDQQIVVENKGQLGNGKIQTHTHL